MPFEEFLAYLLTVGVGAFTIIKVARLFANRSRSLPDDIGDRVQGLEHALRSVQQELAEVHERLDFAERLLRAARDERRTGG
jgi:hypothetical protein